MFYLYAFLPYRKYSTYMTISGTHDFFGLNHYTTQLIAAKTHPMNTSASYGSDQDIEESHDPAWPG